MPSHDQYALIDIDRFEPNIVRRRLRRLSELHDREAAIQLNSAAARPLVEQLQRQGLLADFKIAQPRYETNVWPLYYYWTNTNGLEHRDVYVKTVEAVKEHFGNVPENLVLRVQSLADAEIDILIEDNAYFTFIEAKEVRAPGKVKFERSEKGHGVHQLVRQYLQGKILEQLIGKPFALATIGANQGNPVEVFSEDSDRQLLQHFGQLLQLTVIDLEWPKDAVLEPRA